jgi:hypothetical protein
VASEEDCSKISELDAEFKEEYFDSDVLDLLHKDINNISTAKGVLAEFYGEKMSEHLKHKTNILRCNLISCPCPYKNCEECTSRIDRYKSSPLFYTTTPRCFNMRRHSF